VAQPQFQPSLSGASTVKPGGFHSDRLRFSGKPYHNKNMSPKRDAAKATARHRSKIPRATVTRKGREAGRQKSLEYIKPTNRFHHTTSMTSPYLHPQLRATREAQKTTRPPEACQTQLLHVKHPRPSGRIRPTHMLDFKSTTRTPGTISFNPDLLVHKVNENSIPVKGGLY
jgi:hypothetical protein